MCADRGTAPPCQERLGDALLTEHPLRICRLTTQTSVSRNRRLKRLKLTLRVG
jgi:hypothetical protein